MVINAILVYMFCGFIITAFAIMYFLYRGHPFSNINWGRVVLAIVFWPVLIVMSVVEAFTDRNIF